MSQNVLQLPVPCYFFVTFSWWNCPLKSFQHKQVVCFLEWMGRSSETFHCIFLKNSKIMNKPNIIKLWDTNSHFLEFISIHCQLIVIRWLFFILVLKGWVGIFSCYNRPIFMELWKNDLSILFLRDFHILQVWLEFTTFIFNTVEQLSGKH